MTHNLSKTQRFPAYQILVCGYNPVIFASTRQRQSSCDALPLYMLPLALLIPDHSSWMCCAMRRWIERWSQHIPWGATLGEGRGTIAWRSTANEIDDVINEDISEIVELAAWWSDRLTSVTLINCGGRSVDDNVNNVIRESNWLIDFLFKTKRRHILACGRL